MKLFKILFILIIISSIMYTQCTPPPPLKEEDIDGVHFKGDYKKEDVAHFLNFFKEMQEAGESKDTEKAFSFYSENFMSDAGVKLDELKKNTILVNKVYGKIKYKMSNVSLHIRNKEAVSTDDYIYSARSIKKGYKSLDLKGMERIYWSKESGEWEIINWVYE